MVVHVQDLVIALFRIINIDHDAFQGLDLAVFAKNRLAGFHDPARCFVPMDKLILSAKTGFAVNGQLPVLPDLIPEFCGDQVIIGNDPVEYNIFWLVAGQFNTAVRYEFHGPVFVVSAAKGDAGQVVDEN